MQRRKSGNRAKIRFVKDRKKKRTVRNAVRVECRNEDRGREAGREGGDLPSVPQEYGLYRVLALLRGYVHCHSTVTI